MVFYRNTLYLLFLLLARPVISQVVLPSFTVVKGTNDYKLGKVVSMAQDKHGYMWFADQTNACLARYDGYRMKIYHSDPADSNSLGAKTFECIAADPSGNIWIGIARGVDMFDNASGKFIHYRYPEGESDRFDNVLLVDHSGIVWIGTSSGLDRLDPSTGKFTRYVHSDKDPTSLSCNMVRSLYEDKNGVLWVGTGIAFDTRTKEGGLNRFNKESSTFTRYLHDSNNPQSLVSDKIRAIFEDSKGNFWVGSDGDGLHIMNRQTGTFERLTYDPRYPEKLSRPPVEKGKIYDHITFINEDVRGKIWIGTYAAGIVCYNPETKKLDHFDINDKKRVGGYTDNSTWACCISKDGTIWISNENSELFRVDPFQAGFSDVKLDTGIQNFFEDSAGNLWMTLGDMGMLMINPKTNGRKLYTHNPADSSSISNNETNFIQPAKNGQWWVGTWNGGNLFTPQTGKFKRFFYSPGAKRLEATGLFSVLEKKDETYFGLSHGILAVQDNKTGAITKYVNNPQDTNSISWGPPGSIGAIVSLLEKSDSNIWVSVWNSEGAALDLFNTRTKKFKHYLNGLTVGDMIRARDGTLWIGTSKGLYFRIDSLDSFVPIGPEESEFRKTRIRSLVEDNDKNIWGITGIGIFRYDPGKKELSIYGDKFGVFDVGTFSYLASGITSKGELLFGNPHGYYKCFPNEVVNRFPPQIAISDFKIDGHSIVGGKEEFLKAALEDTKEITLTHDQNILSIDYAAIHFSDPESNSLQYILEGYEHEWREGKRINSAYYFNVPPGHYTFRLKSGSSYGVVSEKTLLITVLPPWWQSWWFWTLEIVTGLGLLFGFIQYRSHNLKQRNILLEKKVTLRTNELKNSLAELKTAQDQLIQSEKMASLGELTSGIAHEIKNPLNFISNFSEINLDVISEIEEDQVSQQATLDPEKTLTNIKTLKKNLEKINHHSKRIDGIVKGMLQHSRLGTLVKEPVNINTVCDDSLKLAYHGFRAKEKTFNATFEKQFDPALPKVMVVPQDFGRVMLNVINNAFYAVNDRKKRNQSESPDEAIQAELSYKPLVTVTTHQSGDKIIITVSDNGMGIPTPIINKIFQPFFTTKPTGEGTGLGLSMSYDIIVKGHGGDLKVKTKGGVGTDFEIVLPIK